MKDVAGCFFLLLHVRSIVLVGCIVGPGRLLQPNGGAVVCCFYSGADFYFACWLMLLPVEFLTKAADGRVDCVSCKTTVKHLRVSDKDLRVSFQPLVVREQVMDDNN